MASTSTQGLAGNSLSPSASLCFSSSPSFGPESSLRAHSRSPSIDAQSFVVLPFDEDTTDPCDSDASSSLSYTGSVDSGSKPFSTLDYLSNSLHNTLQSLELDRATVQQAQFSGQLRAKSLELQAVVTAVEAKLQEVIKLYERTRPVVKLVKRDLAWAEKRLSGMMKAASKEWPVEYNRAKDKVVHRAED